MNKYLDKVASNLPYRDRVEVFIVRPDNKILVTLNDGWIGLPGGGVDGNSHEDACKEEALEEVGVGIHNVRDLGFSHQQEGISPTKNRHLYFRGTQTKWFAADYNGIDKSKYGVDGDSVKHVWKTPDEVLHLFKTQGKIYPAGIKAMEHLRDHLQR